MEQFDNDSEHISASEINRFIYCHYQWYYERKYGMKYLRKLRAERNKELGYTDPSKSRLVNGRAFHNSYIKHDRMRRVSKLILLIIFITVSAMIYYYFVKL